MSFVSPEGAVHFEVVIVFDNPGTLTEKMDASAMLTASDGSEIYPYENGKTQFYEARDVLAKAASSSSLFISSWASFSAFSAASL